MWKNACIQSMSCRHRLCSGLFFFSSFLILCDSRSLLMYVQEEGPFTRKSHPRQVFFCSQHCRTKDYTYPTCCIHMCGDNFHISLSVYVYTCRYTYYIYTFARIVRAYEYKVFMYMYVCVCIDVYSYV